MSQSIKKLSAELINKISAGEVVVSPASVIKELVENSIDAGATRINVKIEAGGKKLISVTDNGIGIRKDEVSLAFDNNSTSKIESVENLSEISTLGFRGEALFSISVVSRVEIITKSEDESVATTARIIDGKVEQIKPAAFNTGTSITVTDLFYNTPARKKHMKSDRAERLSSVDMVSKLAVSNPSVSFRLESDGKEVFMTPGDESIRNTLLSVMGKDYLSDMVEVDYSDTPLTLKGYTLSGNFLDRKNEESILVVNGRYVKNDRLSRAINDLYREQYGLFTKRISYVLYVTLPANFTDVNIHPAKTTISFRNETLISMLILEGIRQALKMTMALDENPARIKSESEEETPVPVQEAFDLEADFRGEVPCPGEEKISAVFENSFADYGFDESLKPSDFGMREEKLEPQIRTHEEKKADRSLFARISQMHFVGTAFRAYAIFEQGDTLYIMDTHAAHERVLYERFLKEYNEGTVARQMLLTPAVIDMSASEKETVLSNLEEFEKMGYELENFSGTSVILRQVPEMLSLEGAKRSILDIADELSKTGMALKSVNRNERLISIACHSAVRGKDEISHEEAVSLLEMLAETDNPFTCPHSRPTVSMIEKKYFERMFQRI